MMLQTSMRWCGEREAVGRRERHTKANASGVAGELMQAADVMRNVFCEAVLRKRRQARKKCKDEDIARGSK